MATPNVRGLVESVRLLLVPIDAVPSVCGLTRGKLPNLTRLTPCAACDARLPVMILVCHAHGKILPGSLSRLLRR